MRGMPALSSALEQVHQPEDVNAERLGRFRLKFEEFLFLQLLLVQHRNAQTKDLPGVPFTGWERPSTASMPSGFPLS